MKFRHRILRVLPVVIPVWSTLPAPAQGQFSQQAKLVGTGAIASASQGVAQGDSVSISSDGNTAIVGGPLDNNIAGAAWVYTRSQGVWSQQAKLVGTGAIGNAQQGDSVSISGDGNTAIVGGNFDSNAAGAAWVYTRSGGVWSQQAKLVGTGAIGPLAAEQGNSVSISGDGNTAIVGGPYDNDGAGAAWVFARSGGVWSQQAKLVGTGAIGNAFQGISVSLSADGKNAIVGGSLDNNVQPGGASGDSFGAAWVFTRSRRVWSQQAKLVGTGAIGNAAQGEAVSISGDGKTAIVGGPFDNNRAGAAWVYTRSRGVWSQQAKLVGTDAIGGPFGGAFQGISVSLSGDGSTAIVGGPFDNNQASNGTNDDPGAAWVYTRSRRVWSQQGPKLVGTGAIGNAEQGEAVSISGDGSTAIVGGPFDNNTVGAAWVYVQSVFAGTPGKANCYSQSVSALARQFGGLNAAAAALGYRSVRALQNAIMEFCEG